MVVVGIIMIIIVIVITITSVNRTLSSQHLGFLYLPILKRQENTSSLPQGEQLCHSIIISITLVQVKRRHVGLLFIWVIFLSLSSQKKRLVKLMQCAVTNALEMPKAQQP